MRRGDRNGNEQREMDMCACAHVRTHARTQVCALSFYFGSSGKQRGIWFFPKWTSLNECVFRTRVQQIAHSNLFCIILHNFFPLLFVLTLMGRESVSASVRKIRIGGMGEWFTDSFIEIQINFCQLVCRESWNILLVFSAVWPLFFQFQQHLFAAPA